jgi:hypothetical protein
MTIQYRRLFEVRILHGYQLDYRPWRKGSATKPFFEHTPDDQAALLVNGYTILKDLEIVPTEATRDLLSGLRMPWRATPTGIVAGIEVNRTGNQFFPKYTLPNTAVFSFLLRVRNPYWYNLTNHALRLPWPSVYHFTNRVNADENKTFPSLATLPQDFAAHPYRTWEMGELSSQGGNIRFATKTDPGAGDFQAVTPANINHFWASTADRRALPKVFRFRFDLKVQPVASVAFNLRNLTDNSLVKALSQTFATPPDAYTADFRFLTPLPGESQPKPIADGWYTLETLVNGAAFGPVQRVQLRSDLPSDDSVFAAIDIVHEPGLPAPFSLLNGNALRLTQDPIDPFRWRPDAVFDIRFLSRPTYWRYRLETGTAATAGQVTALDAATLQTNGPVYLTQSFQSIAYGNNAVDFLPNPANLNLKFNPADNQYYSEIFVSL